MVNSSRNQYVENMKIDLERRISTDDIPTANVCMAGMTGAGKSTLINAVFGEYLAEEGVGKPVTPGIKEYGTKEDKIHIWDSQGFELDHENTKRSINEIIKVIVEKNDLKDKYNKIHAIWYCVNFQGSRYQEGDIDFIKPLYALGVPFIIVLTRCLADEETIEAFRNEIYKINRKNGLDKIEVVSVLAKEMKINRVSQPIPAYGLKNLVDITLQRLPQYIKEGFIAAQRVSKDQKRKECEEIIFDYVEGARRGFWEKVPFVNIFIADSTIQNMFIKVAALYNVNIDREKLKAMITKIGHIDVENGFFGLLWPIKTEYDKKVEDLLRKHMGSEYDNYKEKFKNEGVARLIAYYGYVFLDSIEILWDELTEEELKNIDYVALKLYEQLKERFATKRR